MRCSACGRENNDGARFCAECGASLPASTSLAPSTGAPATVTTQPLVRDAQWPVPASPAGLGSSAATPGGPSAVQGSIPASWPAAQSGGPGQGYGGNQNAANQNVVVNTNVNVGGPNIVFMQKNNGPNFFVRFIWFLFIGSWLGPICLVVAYLLFLLIVTIPLSMGLFNRIPQIMTLRPRTSNMGVTNVNGVTVVQETTHEQHPWYIRVPYFIFIGSWVTLLWFSVAWILSALSLFTFGLSLIPAILMYDRVGAVATLYRT